jgi:hypothetical protein
LSEKAHFPLSEYPKYKIAQIQGSGILAAAEGCLLYWFDWFNLFNWFGLNQPIQPMKLIKLIEQIIVENL